MRKVWKVIPHFVGSIFLLFFCAAGAQIRPHQSLKTPQAPSSLPNLRSANRVVAVLVNDNGLFSIGTADNRPLLYDFPFLDFRSHLNVRLDGRVSGNDSSRAKVPLLSLLRAPAQQADSSITCLYGFDEVLIEQRLRLEQYSDSTGAVFMQYVLTNSARAPHEIGLLLELDTKVNGNDNAPFLTNFGFRNDEVIFTGAGVPDFLQAFEMLPPEKGLVAKFTLVGGEAVRPNFIALGDWVNLSKVVWDYTVPVPPVPYNDSAVILRWDPVVVAPGESRTIGAYYGVGEVSSASDTLTVSVIAPERLQVQGDTLSPNPFSVSVLVTNTGFAAAHDVQARLVLPRDLQFAANETALKDLTPRDLAPQASGTATWKIHARCLPADSVFKMRMEVTSSDAPGNAVVRAIQVPSCFGPSFELSLQPQTKDLIAGEAAQVAVQTTRRGNFTEDVALEIWPEIPGIDFTLTPTRVAPGMSAQLDVRTLNTLLAGDYRFVVHGRSATTAKSDTLTLHVQAALIDLTPPFTRNRNPAVGAENVLPESAITFEMRDEGVGVDAAALVLLVNEQPVSPQIFSFDQKHVRVEYQALQPFRYNEIVSVTIRGRDLANPPNIMPEEKYSFAIVRDLEPPVLTDLSPPRETPRAAPDAEISFHLRDELAGVDANSVRLEVNGALVQTQQSGTSRDLIVRYLPPQPFIKGEIVNVRIAAQDLALPPNAMPAEQYSFRVEEPVYDLIAESLQPLGEVRAGALTNIIGEVRNGLDAVRQPFRVRFQVDGAAVKDTLFTAFAAGAEERLRVPVRFVAPGLHEITMQVDADNGVAELSEGNNEQNLFVEILPPLMREFSVRPNPFTPNRDGFNDAVEFNFATLDLESPSLRIFDVDGVVVVSEEALRSGVFTWDGRDRNGRDLPPGIYLYSLRDRGRNVANGHVLLAR